MPSFFVVVLIKGPMLTRTVTPARGLPVPSSRTVPTTGWPGLAAYWNVAG